MEENFDGIVIQGARQNNLKNIDVRIPRNKLVVITGVSGSGKSSLAFDTIYAEGQRRYMESLSSFARQFMKQMEKPQVDKISGLNPAVAIEQHTIYPELTLHRRLHHRGDRLLAGVVCPPGRHALPAMRASRRALSAQQIAR